MGHPYEAKVSTYPLSNDPNSSRANGERLVQELDASQSALQVLEPTAPVEAIHAAMDRASVALQAVTVALGPLHGWTVAWRAAIHRQAQRLLGEQQTRVSQPAWSEP